MSRVCFIIFAHSLDHTREDLQDMIENIQYFHKDCDFIVNHPTIEHPKIRVRHMPGVLDQSNFIFGAYEKILKDLILTIGESDIKQRLKVFESLMIPILIITKVR